MNESSETTPFNDKKEKEKKKSAHMWRTIVIVSTLLGLGMLISLYLFFSNANSNRNITEFSTNLQPNLSLLHGLPESKFFFFLGSNDHYNYHYDDILTIANTNHELHDISNGISFYEFKTKNRANDRSFPYISVVADRHKTHDVATSFCQKSAINNVGTRITHTGPGGDYPSELNFWVQFDTLSFDVTNPDNTKKTGWTILNFVIGQGSATGGRNNWWYGAPSCTEKKEGIENREGTLVALVCETTIAGHYIVLRKADSYSVNVSCRVGINSKTDIKCTNA